MYEIPRRELPFLRFNDDHTFLYISMSPPLPYITVGNKGHFTPRDVKRRTKFQLKQKGYLRDEININLGKGCTKFKGVNCPSAGKQAGCGDKVPVVLAHKN